MAENAHTRIGRIECAIERKKASTRVAAHFERFAIDKQGHAHMVSIFGNDAEIAALQAAILTDIPLTAITPDGKYHTLRFGEKAATYKGHIQIQGRQRPLRHLLAFSRAILQNGTEGKVYLLNQDPGLVWATIVSYLGLPGVPEWADAAISWLRRSGKLIEMEGYQCEPLAVSTTREEMLEWIGANVKAKDIPFPEYAGPIFWPQYGLEHIVSPVRLDAGDKEDKGDGLKAAA
jgi:hypothetical protein